MLVEYPIRDEFIDMMTSKAYAGCNVHRLIGLERHTIISADEQLSRYR